MPECFEAARRMAVTGLEGVAIRCTSPRAVVAWEVVANETVGAEVAVAEAAGVTGRVGGLVSSVADVPTGFSAASPDTVVCLVAPLTGAAGSAGLTGSEGFDSCA
jgi:hypothetical protein